jgi:uncharacterized protein
LCGFGCGATALCKLCDLRTLFSTSVSESSLNEKEPAIALPVMVFLVLLLCFSAAVTGLNFFLGFFRLNPPVVLAVSMWIPGLAGILAARCTKLSLFGPQRSRIRFLALAVVGPVGVCGMVRGALWLSGLETMQTDLGEIGVGSSSPLVLGLLFSVLGALGEEIGWRGFLGPVLARRLKFTALVWVTWLPWFVFYIWLFFLAGSYSRPTFGLQMVTLGSLLFGLNVLLMWLRLRSRSLWPPVLFHAVHNFLVFNPVALGESHRPWLTGELGLALACGYLAICIGSLWDGRSLK